MKKTVRRGVFLKKVKDISIAATFSVAVCLGTFSCTEEEVYEKGVQTFITETETGTFKIVDEKTRPDKICRRRYLPQRANGHLKRRTSRKTCRATIQTA
jgi:hypothetical protein